MAKMTAARVPARKERYRGRPHVPEQTEGVCADTEKNDMTHIDVAGIAAQQVIALGQQNIHEQDDEKSIQIGHD